jgi:hypothetical protein
MSTIEEFVRQAFIRAKEQGCEGYAYVTGALQYRYDELEKENQKLRDELNKGTGNKILDAIIRDTKFTDLEEKSDRDSLVDALREYIRQLEKLEYEPEMTEDDYYESYCDEAYHQWRDDQLIQEEA